MSCVLYKLENTGLTSQSITVTDCSSCVTNLSILPGEFYYVNTPSISSIGNIVSTKIIDPANIVYYFSSICNDTKFYLYADNGGPFIINNYYCFGEVIDCNYSSDILSGCFHLAATGLTNTLGYPEYFAVSDPLYNDFSSGACLSICSCCGNNICVNGTGFDYDDNYEFAGSYGGYDYWSGTTNGYFIYYSSSEDSWCLSGALGDPCLLFGPSPCFSSCPDLCDDFTSYVVCPTPTPTPTINCDVFDFNATFDCLVSPSPTPTPTPTITPTVTPTLTPNIFCSGVTVDADIIFISATPTPTPTITPTSSISFDRGCVFNGDVTFNVIDSQIKCPLSKEFKDCLNEVSYYTTLSITTPSGTSLDEGMVFVADVNGVQRCIHYVGENYSVLGINTISLTEGPLGYFNEEGCKLCPVPESPTPTPTLTPTPTPSKPCENVIIVDAIAPVNPLLVGLGSQITQFSQSGTRVHRLGDYTSCGTGTTFTLLTTPIVWRSTSSTNGPMNRTSVFSNPVIDKTWIGFTFCVDISESKNYFVGMGADNDSKLYIDGNLVVDTTICRFNNIGNFKIWWVYEVNLPVGKHVFQLLGYNDFSSAGMGAEIYDNTFSDLTGATSVSMLNRIFTTEGLNNGTNIFDVVQDANTGIYTNSGYTCPEGFTYACGQCYQFSNSCETTTTTVQNCMVYRISVIKDSKITFNGCCSNQGQTSTNVSPSAQSGLLICSTTLPVIVSGQGTVTPVNVPCQGCFTSPTPTPTVTVTPTPTVTVTPTMTPTPTPTSSCIQYLVSYGGEYPQFTKTLSYTGCCPTGPTQIILSKNAPPVSICSSTIPSVIGPLGGVIIIPSGPCPDC